MRTWEVVSGIGAWLVFAFGVMYLMNRGTQSRWLRWRYGWAKGREPFFMALGLVLLPVGLIGMLLSR
jgi:hypothetical protein